MLTNLMHKSCLLSVIDFREHLFLVISSGLHVSFNQSGESCKLHPAPITQLHNLFVEDCLMSQFQDNRLYMSNKIYD